MSATCVSRSVSDMEGSRAVLAIARKWPKISTAGFLLALYVAQKLVYQIHFRALVSSVRVERSHFEIRR